MSDRAAAMVIALSLVYPVGCDVRAHDQQSLAAYDTKITAISISPNGKTIAVADQDERFRGTLRLWDLSGPRRREIIHAKWGYIKGVTFSPDGRWIAYLDAANEVAIDECEGGFRRIRIKSDIGRIVRVLTFSRDGASLLVGYQDQVLRVDVSSGKYTSIPGLKPASEFESNAPIQLAESLNQRWLAIARIDHTGSRLSLHDSKSGDLLDFRARGIDAVQFLPHSNALVYTSGERLTGSNITFLNPEIDSRAGPYEIFDRGQIHSLDCSPDGELIAICGSGDVQRDGKRQFDMQIVLFDVPQRRVVVRVTGLSRKCQNVAFSVDGLDLIGPGLEHSLKVWKTAEVLKMRD